MEGKEE